MQLRRGGQAARRRRGGDHRAVDRGRPLRPDHPGLHRAGDVLADGATLATEQHLGPARARPDLLQPQRPQRRARSRRAPTATAPSPTCSRSPPTTSAARASSSTRRSRTSASSPQTLDDNKEELFGSAARAREVHQHPRPERQRRSAPFNQSLSNVSTMLNGERDELAASLQNLSIGARRGGPFVKDNKASLTPQHQGHQPGRQGAGQAARGPRGDPHHRPGRPQQPGADLQPAGRHARHQRQPRPESVEQDVQPGPGAAARSSSQRPDGGALRPIAQILPRAGVSWAQGTGSS